LLKRIEFAFEHNCIVFERQSIDSVRLVKQQLLIYMVTWCD